MRLQAILRIAECRGREGHADRRVPQPLGIRRPNVDDGMMHILRAGGMDLRHLNPFVLC